jgi:hypothetical protein
MATIYNQSKGLSDRHLHMHQNEKRTLVDDSNISEGNLKTIIDPLIQFAKDEIEPYGGIIEYHKKLSLDDIMKYRMDDTFLFPTIEEQKDNKDVKNDNSRVSIKPDAGIILWKINNKHYPIYIGEDKIQGTNDKLFEAGKPKQATGNAIERYFKNVRAEELLCSRLPYFPSVVFASGCDFHHSETIAKRLEAGNYGVPNLYAEITNDHPTISETELSETFIQKVNVIKRYISMYMPFASIPTVCVKAHKWDQMKHLSSLWLPAEYLEISKEIIKQSVERVNLIVKSETL